MAAFQFPGQTGFYRGKVRDVYFIGDDRLVMIASDRISAFDVILPRPIPYKGQVLNSLAAFMLEATADICPNWLRSVPAQQASLGVRCQPLKVEVVVRGYLCGHAWRTYASGGRELCGASLPDGLRENDPFHQPIITPSTKADAGHDEDISVSQILSQGLVKEKDWETVQSYALQLFARGSEIARRQGLLLADTKYEFGLYEGQVYLMDEVHTPDSSRYFIASGFEKRQASGQKQQQLSKEFVREWLMANGFMGKEGQEVPNMDDEWVSTISRRYIDLYERITGTSFQPEPLDDASLQHRIEEALKRA